MHVNVTGPPSTFPPCPPLVLCPPSPRTSANPSAPGLRARAHAPRRAIPPYRPAQR
jgi:hypothetical protein